MEALWAGVGPAYTWEPLAGCFQPLCLSFLLKKGSIAHATERGREGGVQTPGYLPPPDTLRAPSNPPPLSCTSPLVPTTTPGLEICPWWAASHLKSDLCCQLSPGSGGITQGPPTCTHGSSRHAPGARRVHSPATAPSPTTHPLRRQLQAAARSLLCPAWPHISEVATPHPLLLSWVTGVGRTGPGVGKEEGGS